MRGESRHGKTLHIPSRPFGKCNVKLLEMGRWREHARQKRVYGSPKQRDYLCGYFRANGMHAGQVLPNSANASRGRAVKAFGDFILSASSA